MTLLAGIDFSCNPSRTKPVTLATGRVLGAVLHLEDLAAMPRLAQLEDWLRTPDPWLGAFDFPFGLPRAFVDANGLGTSCAEVIAAVHARCPTRMAWRAFIDAWGNTQPAGARLLHRRRAPPRRRCPKASWTPASRARRHSITCEEYNPSRRRI